MELDEKRNRYLHDPKFHATVDLLRGALIQGDLRVYDLVPAAELAAELYLLQNVQQIIYGPRE